MTDPIVSLDVDRVEVEPGGQASVTVKITNPGSIVEGYLVEVVGEGVREWGEALPPEISIYPQQDANAVIVFSPPGGTGAPGGTWPFGIRVRSTEDPDASAVVEADLEIGKVFGLQAKLLPVNSSGRWRGVHVVQVSNWGNAPVSLRLSAANPDEALGFMIRPEVVDLPLGAMATARVWAKTKSPFLRGTVTRIPFTVTGESEDAPAQQGSVPQYGGTPDRPSVDGAFNQKPILSRGAVMVAALALLAVVGGVAWTLAQPGPAQATFQELGPPPPPREVEAEPIGPDSVRVRWAAVPSVEDYTVARVLDDGSRTGSVQVPVTDTATTIGGLPPATSVCFVVQARRGERPGPFSEQACAETPAAASTAAPTIAGPSPTDAASATSPGEARPSDGAGSSDETPSGGTGSSEDPSSGGPGSSEEPPDPSFTGKWFAAAFWPVQGTTYDPADKLAELRALDKTAGLVNSSTYANMTPRLQVESWVLHLGPYDTEAEASASCATLRKVHPDCLPVQLDP